MNLYGRSSMWAAALALGLAGLISVGTAAVLAAPAGTGPSEFEITVETDTLTWEETFRSRAPFCAKGTIEQVGRVSAYGSWGRKLELRCDDGTGSLTVLVWPTTWQILDGSAGYADLRGKGSVRDDLVDLSMFRSTLVGIADRDNVAPTIAFSNATATKLSRPRGAYMLTLGLTLRDDVIANPVAYTLRASAGGYELARRFGTETTGEVSLTLRVRPLFKVWPVRLELTGVDPVGNEVSTRRTVRLPR